MKTGQSGPSQMISAQNRFGPAGNALSPSGPIPPPHPGLTDISPTRFASPT